MTDTGKYECDVCNRMTDRHRIVTLVIYGTDTSACERCRGYDPRDYDEEPEEDE